jgi:hypothetical protein
MLESFSLVNNMNTMARMHIHNMFGKRYAHSTLFRHTSQEDQAAHSLELLTHARFAQQKTRRKSLKSASRTVRIQ